MPEQPESKAPSRRRQNRVAAMQFLYMMDVNPPEEMKSAIKAFFDAREESRDYYGFSEELIYGVAEYLSAIDDVIKKHAVNWAFDRIAKVDLAILRLAIYELLYRKDIPPIVSINEAIDLSKEFSADDSKRFINGILDKIKGDLNRPLRSPSEE